MRCPKCQFDHELQTTECLKCGIVFARYQAALEAKGAGLPVPGLPIPPPPPIAPPPDPYDARKELKYRALALPLALLLGRVIGGTPFAFLSGLLTMEIHECGHAATAWLTGRWAVPSFGVTMTGEYRSWWVILALMGGLVFGGYLALKAQRWRWVLAAAAGLTLQLKILSLPAFTQGSLIVFGGDGGALVLATFLMLTFYVSRQTLLYKRDGVRWALLVVGALSFMYVYHLWSGPWENIPFGEIEGVNLSDPTRLTDEYGWSVIQLVDRYLLLAKVCFAALLVTYVWGLVSTFLDVRSETPPL
jgi:hypothetical protein